MTIPPRAIAEKIPFVDLARENQAFESKFREYLNEILATGAYISSKYNRAFEDSLAVATQSTHAIGVSSGTDALTLGIKALNLPEQSEILVPSNTFIASVFAISHAGHTPVLVEPDIATCNVSAENIRAAITPKTRAIVAVHLYGRAAPMGEIMAAAQEHDLKVVEDCAQAFGASYQGKALGSWGDLAAFSFFPTKTLGGIGDGGAITTSNPKIAHQIMAMRQQGALVKNEHLQIGGNSKLSEIEAAFLYAKIGAVEELANKRRSVARYYLDHIRNPKLVLPEPPRHREEHVWHLFALRTLERDAFQKHLTDHGIGSISHYPKPIHLQKAYKGFFKGSYPIAEEISRTTLSLPMHSVLEVEQLKRVVDVVNGF